MLEWLDTAVRLLAVLGLPTVTIWFLRDRRRLKNEAKLEESTLPNRVRTSSVVTLEAEIMALSNSFDTDRRLKEETIRWLTSQLEEARIEIQDRDLIIDNLQEQLTSLKAKVRILTEDLDAVQAELDTIRKGRNHG